MIGRIMSYGVLASILLTGVKLPALDDHPYASIAAKNVFRLIDPPPHGPVGPSGIVGIPRKVDVKLTGITSVLQQKNALLVIHQSGSNRSPTSSGMILQEGETRQGVQVLSINMETSTVHVRVGGVMRMVTLF